MAEVSNIDSVNNLEFPRQIQLIKRLRFLSFLINDVVLVGSIGAILYLLIQSLGITLPLLSNIKYQPITPVLFVFTSITLLFGAKRHQLNSERNTEKESRPWYIIWIPIMLAEITALVGFLNMLSLMRDGLPSFLYLSPFSGFCFFLIGLSLIPPFTGIRHRFHITQLLTFIVSGISVFIVLEHIYQMFSSQSIQQVIQVPFMIACVYVFFSCGVLLRWTNRGFFGNFTLNSTVSTLALRLFLTNLFLGPLITYLVLLTTQSMSLNGFQVITIVVSLFAFISSALIWLNVKSLYRYEMENLLMRETLRFHNIDLTKDKTALITKMNQLEVEKQNYLDKLDSKNSWQEAAEKFG